MDLKNILNLKRTLTILKRRNHKWWKLFHTWWILNSDYYKSYSRRSQNLVRVLFNKLIDADIEFLIKKRAGNDIILVAPSRVGAEKDKNVLTVWIRVGNIDIEIRGVYCHAVTLHWRTVGWRAYRKSKKKICGNKADTEIRQDLTDLSYLNSSLRLCIKKLDNGYSHYPTLIIFCLAPSN